MLRDRYYLGYVTYRGEELPGRHEPLVDEDLFDRVQAVLDVRAAGVRRRVHLHHLKGVLYCGLCHQAGVIGRMVIQHTVTRRGDEYTYFFCRNRQQRTCRAPYVNIVTAEQAVQRYYANLNPERIVDALARLAMGDFGADARGQDCDLVRVYGGCTTDQRRLLNQALFSRLYLVDDRITGHEF